ncbi:uncharacterized protein JCM10292_005090 [Rhodotorula paludigena]|uniref:uncharacterized protein n=1 Tax=Rhodotorula paludigena TaxID=86838 RepID=UPI00317DA19D
MSSTTSGSAPTTHSGGPIPLRKEDFPLLHSLLDSAQYREALDKNPDLSRRPSTRQTIPSGGYAKSIKRGASRQVKKPPRKGETSVDLWARVPRALGSSTASIVGSRRSSAGTRGPKQSAEWELIEDANAVETVQDALWTGSIGRTRGKAPPHLSVSASAVSTDVEHEAAYRPELPQNQQGATLPCLVVASGGKVGDQTGPSCIQTSISDKSDSVALDLAGCSAPSTAERSLLATRSLPDLPPTANVSIHQPVLASYSSRAPGPSGALDDGKPGKTRPSTTFHAAVSNLKRMLSRTSSRSTRPLRPSTAYSTYSDSAFSTSTIFGGGGRSRSGSLLRFSSPSSGYVDAVAETGHLVGIPASYRPTSVAVPHPDEPEQNGRQRDFLAARRADRASYAESMGPVKAADQDDDLEARREHRRQLYQVLREGPPAPPLPARKAQPPRGSSWKASLRRLAGRGSGSSHRFSFASSRSPSLDRHTIFSIPSDARYFAPAAQHAAPACPPPAPLASAPSTRAAGSSLAPGAARTEQSKGSDTARPSLVRARTLEEPPGATTHEEVVYEVAEERPATGYWAYGSRWEEGELSNEVRRVRGGIEDGEDEKVWRKWRKGVREGREALRIQAL